MSTWVVVFLEIRCLHAEVFGTKLVYAVCLTLNAAY